MERGHQWGCPGWGSCPPTSVILDRPRVRWIPEPGVPHMIVTLPGGVGGREGRAVGAGPGAVGPVTASGGGFDAICVSRGSV